MLLENSTQARYWLALNRTSLNACERLNILQRFPNPKVLFDSPPPPEISASVHLILKQVNWKQVDQDLSWLEASPQRFLIHYPCKRYPLLLKQIADPPIVLFLEGNMEIIHQPQIAIVGSRLPSAGGIRAAQSFSQQLSQHAFVVTSGLARGIDGAAQYAACQQAAPTLAVMATGLDHIYPAQHQALAQDILAHRGALLSELPTQTPPLRHHFPQRNRLISGLSLGTLVIEAKIKSGSLITARHAAEQGREVFALPGSIYNPQTAGCHQLIQQGAKLVTSIADILIEIDPKHTSVPPHTPTNPSNPPLNPLNQQVLQHIDFHTTHLDTLAQQCGLPTNSLYQALSQLELSGWILRHNNGYTRLH